MKAVIKSTEYIKEYETKYGTMYLFKILYDDKTAFYSSKSKDQKKFIKGQEAEFTEEITTKNGKEFLNIKPFYNKGQSNYGKNLKREQAKYSGFAMSYAKDLVVSGSITYDQMFLEAQLMFDWMVEKDKELQS